MTFGVLSKLSIASSPVHSAVKRLLFKMLDVDTVAALGTDQTDAAPLTAGKNVVTAADGTVGVILPVAVEGMSVEIVNTVSNQDLKVYPNTGAQINSLTATTGAFTVVAAAGRTFHCDAPLHWYVSAGNLTGTATTSSTAELNYNDIATLGTLQASKVWTSDASLDTIMPTGGLLTVQSGGVVTLNSGATLTNNATEVRTAQAAEHGVGAIGTSSFGAPQTRRWTDAGVITTQIKFDLTGLASVATGNDVIGLAAGGAAYVGRNVVATNGVIFKTSISVLETPTGGDNDVNVVTSANAALAYDGAGGTTYLVGDLGDLLVGKTVENLVPALTEGDYFYLTAGTGDTAAEYTAGMYVLTLYGHAVLA